MRWNSTSKWRLFKFSAATLGSATRQPRISIYSIRFDSIALRVKFEIVVCFSSAVSAKRKGLRQRANERLNDSAARNATCAVVRCDGPTASNCSTLNACRRARASTDRALSTKGGAYESAKKRWHSTADTGCTTKQHLYSSIPLYITCPEYVGYRAKGTSINLVVYWDDETILRQRDGKSKKKTLSILLKKPPWRQRGVRTGSRWAQGYKKKRRIRGEMHFRWESIYIRVSERITNNKKSFFTLI